VSAPALLKTGLSRFGARWPLVAVLLLLAYRPTVAGAQQQPNVPDVREAFAQIDGYCGLPSRPKSEAEWETLLRSMGLRPIAGDAVNRWKRVSVEGSIVANATFLDDTVFYFLIFYPSNSPTLAPAILDWLLKSSPFTNVIEGDRLEIKREVATPLAPGGSARHSTVIVSASTGGIVRIEINHAWRLR
jgi:hypothetical protein